MTFSPSLLENAILILVKNSAQAMYFNSRQEALHFLALSSHLSRDQEKSQVQRRMTSHLPLSGNFKLSNINVSRQAFNVQPQ